MSSIKLVTILSSLIILLVILTVCLIFGSKVKKLKIGDKPGKMTAVVIKFIEWFNNFVRSNIGLHWRYVAPLALTLGTFIFLSNISGLMFFMDTPTKYTATTLSLAIFAVFTIQSTGIVSRKWKHLRTFADPLSGSMLVLSPIMVPLNIMSDLTPLISMTLRLFGNVASGSVLIGLIYSFSNSEWLWIITPIPALLLHIIFDFAFGFIQTLVFVLLTVIFASNKVEETDFEILLKEGEMNNA